MGRKIEFVNLARQQDAAHRDGSLNLSSLATTLDQSVRDSSSSASVAPHGESAKRRGRKAQAAADEREMAQYKGVLGFQAFQQDPLGALEQHIRNSLKKQKEDGT